MATIILGKGKVFSVGGTTETAAPAFSLAQDTEVWRLLRGKDFKKLIVVLNEASNKD